CRPRFQRSVAPGGALVSVGLVAALLWRLFPAGGGYPFSSSEFAAACAFAVLGAASTWRVRLAQPLPWVFAVFLAACAVAFAIPGPLGENITRLRFAALPICVLVFGVRQWRPRWLAASAVVLAAWWNVSPFAVNVMQAVHDGTNRSLYWQPIISFLRHHDRLGYRVEAVDTLDH